jgi:hypothetical protein
MGKDGPKHWLLGKQAETYGDLPVWEGDLAVGTSVRSSGAPPKNKRHVVCCGLWLYVFKKPSKPEHQVHVLDITALESTATAVAVVRYMYKKKSETLVFSSGTDLVPFLRALRTVLRDVHNGAPEEAAYVRVALPDALACEPGAPYAKSPAQAIADAYRAWCSYRGKLHVDVFARFVAQLPEAKREIDLSACPAIDPDTPISLDIPAALMSLAHDRRFAAVAMRNVRSEYAAVFLGSALRLNTVITKIALEDIPEEQDVGAIGQSLGASVVQVMSLARSKISGSGFLRLCAAIGELTRPVAAIDLSGCKLSGKAMTAFFSAIRKSEAVTASLKHLNVSGNRLDEAAAGELLQWVDTYKGRLPLKTLLLANCGLDVTHAKTFLNHLVGLESVDLAGNTVNYKLGDNLDTMVANSQALAHFGASNMEMPAA